MTGEGSEYGRTRRREHLEDHEADVERIVREAIDEVRSEIEEREPKERPEQLESEYDPEQCVREAIEEVQQEESERQKNMREVCVSSKEVQETEEYDVERCVREAINEVEEEDTERQRSREERAETADKDEYEELEKRILDGFDEYGIDPEEVKERWRERYEKEVNEELEGSDRDNVKREAGEKTGEEQTAEEHYYYDDNSGQMYEMKMENQGSTSTEVEVSCGSSEPVQEIKSESIPSDGIEGEKQEEEQNESHCSESEPPSVREQREQDTRPEVDTNDAQETREQKHKQREHVGDGESSELGVELEESSEPTKETVKEENEDLQISEEDVESSSPEQQRAIEPDAAPEHSEQIEDKQEQQETREEEIWEDYEAEYSSPEDEAWQQYLREVFNELPEEEKEGFRECIRDQVESIEDFEELARRHGLEELLEDEEVMEEIRAYLELRERLENEPDVAIEQLAEELEIDIELARDCGNGESEPYSLKRLLNLDALYIWDEIVRTYREQGLPDTREEFEQRLREIYELRWDQYSPLEHDDAVAWIEIMAMRRRGEIQRRIRNGREIYSRKQIQGLSEKYAISAVEIIKWLRGEKVASLIEKLRRHSQEKSSLKSEKERQLQRIHRLHTKEHLSERKIAERLKMPQNQVRGALQDWEIYERYYVQKQTLSHIASEMGLTITKLRGVFKKYDWKLQIQTPRPQPSVEEIRRLHLEDGLTFIQIASRTGLQMDDIRNAIGTKKGQTTPEEIHILYFKDGYSFEQICDILGISMKTIRRAFRKNKWKFRKAARTKQLDEKWVHHLHYIEGFSHDEIADILGVHTATINKLFHDKKWVSRGRKTVPVKGDIDLQRREYQRERRKKLKETRIQMFGTKCNACGSEKKPNKNLHLHRKDGTEHSRHLFRAQKKLESLNPDEWAALCDRCHLGIHLLMKIFRFDWFRIEKFFGKTEESSRKSKEFSKHQNDNLLVTKEFKQMIQNFKGTAEDLRNLIFGEKCSLCGNKSQGKTLIIHRKDGETHDPQEMKRKNHLKTLNPSEWAFVCHDCHNIAEWALDILEIKWSDLVNRIKGN